MNELGYFENSLEHSGLIIEERSAPGSSILSRVLIGTGVVFGQMSKPLSMIIGGEKVTFREMSTQDAFRSCDMTDVVCCIDHTDARLLGRTPTTCRLTLDSRGVHYDVDLPNLPIRQEVIEYVDRRDFRGCSFRFLPPLDEWEVRSDGSIIRHLTEVSKMIDIGPVLRPAYAQTSVAARSYSEFLQEELRSDLPPSIVRSLDKQRRELDIRSRELRLKMYLH